MSGEADPSRPQLVYVGDPMCSWCWGFAPVLGELVDRHDLELTIVVGGLRPGPAAQPLEPALRRFLLHHWDQVAAASGQSFNRSALETRGTSWRYDTQPAATAVVAMRALDAPRELEFFTRLQRAFYAEGCDVTDPTLFPEIAAEVGVDAGAFARAYADVDASGAVHEDFAEARRLGVSGFPTTLLRIGPRLRMLSGGYAPYARVDEVLHAVLGRFDPELDLGAACSLGSEC